MHRYFSGMYPRNGAEGTRTPGLYSAIVALSQLSYSPSTHGWHYTICAQLGKGNSVIALADGIRDGERDLP